MKCEKCKKRDVNAKVIIQGKDGKEELNLCHICFQEFLKENPELKMNNGELDSMIQGMLLSAIKQIGNKITGQSVNLTSEEDKKQEEVHGVCSMCKTSLSDLRNKKRAGCEKCFLIFKNEIDTILDNAIGENTYDELLVTNDPDKRIEILEFRLDEAIEEEHYELAAKLRDDINRLKTK